MYLRWHEVGQHWVWRAASERYLPTGLWIYDLKLVASERRDGKPRQRVVCYLGRINAYLMTAEDTAETWRARFWDKLYARLDACPEVDAVTRAKVLAEISAAVPEDDVDAPIVLPERVLARPLSAAAIDRDATAKVAGEIQVRRQNLLDLDRVTKRMPELREYIQAGTMTTHEARLLADTEPDVRAMLLANWRAGQRNEAATPQSPANGTPAQREYARQKLTEHGIEIPAFLKEPESSTDAG